MFNYNKLDECIRKSGKTRTYLCSKLGRPAYYLRDVIRQRNTIPEEYQQILANELGVSVEYLNDMPEDTKKDPETLTGIEAKLVDLLTQLNPSEEEKVVAYIEGLLANRTI